MQANQKVFILITYILLGSSFVGFALTVNPPINFCLVDLGFSGVLVVVKNLFYVPKAIRQKVTACDVGIIALFTAMLFGLPSYMGLVKCFIMAIIGGGCTGLLAWKIYSD